MRYLYGVVSIQCIEITVNKVHCRSDRGSFFLIGTVFNIQSVVFKHIICGRLFTKLRHILFEIPSDLSAKHYIAVKRHSEICNEYSKTV